jgi:hypothetical protein
MGALPSAGASAYKTTWSQFKKHPFEALKKLGNNSAVKNFGNMLKHPIVSLKGFAVDGVKGFGSGVKGAFSGFKDGFGKGMKTLGSKGLKGLASFTGFDKILDGGKLGWAAFVDRKSFAEVSEMAYKSIGMESVANLYELNGTKETDYNALLTANNDKLTTAAGNNDITSSFTEMKVKFDPASTSNQRDVFYDALKNDKNLSVQLRETTGIDMDDIASRGQLNTALNNSGYTLKYDVPTSGGNGTVSMVPSWAEKALGGNNGSGTLRVMESLGHGANGVNYAFRRDVLKEYNKYVSTKVEYFGANMASDLFKKNMEYKAFEFAADFYGGDGEGMQNIDKVAIKQIASSWFD